MIGTGICHIIDILERRFVITKHKRQKYRCRCGQCVETAPGPVKFFAGARYSPNFAVIVAVDKYTDHMPLERQVRAMPSTSTRGRSGIRSTRSGAYSSLCTSDCTRMCSRSK